MGQKYTVSCPDCGYGFSFFQGCGMFDCTIAGRDRHKEKIMAGAFGEELKRILEKHPDAYLSFSRELLYCKECIRYANRSVYRIYERAGDGRADALLFVLEYACVKCHKPMEMIGGKDRDYFVAPLKLPCPRCNGSADVRTMLYFD